MLGTLTAWHHSPPKKNRAYRKLFLAPDLVPFPLAICCICPTISHVPRPVASQHLDMRSHSAGRFRRASPLPRRRVLRGRCTPSVAIGQKHLPLEFRRARESRLGVRMWRPWVLECCSHARRAIRVLGGANLRPCPVLGTERGRPPLCKSSSDTPVSTPRQITVCSSPPPPPAPPFSPSQPPPLPPAVSALPRATPACTRHSARSPAQTPRAAASCPAPPSAHTPRRPSAPARARRTPAGSRPAAAWTARLRESGRRSARCRGRGRRSGGGRPGLRQLGRV